MTKVAIKSEKLSPFGGIFFNNGAIWLQALICNWLNPRYEMQTVWLSIQRNHPLPPMRLFLWRLMHRGCHHSSDVPPLVSSDTSHTFICFSETWQHLGKAQTSLVQLSVCTSFPHSDILSRCFHFGFLKFLFSVCFFWLFPLFTNTDNQHFSTWKQVFKKKIMIVVCTGSFSWLQHSRCFMVWSRSYM